MADSGTTPIIDLCLAALGIKSERTLASWVVYFMPQVLRDYRVRVPFAGA